MNRRSDLPTTAELEISAELWNALAARVSRRTDRLALFCTRDKAVRIAVMALDAATDEWLAGYQARMADDLTQTAVHVLQDCAGADCTVFGCTWPQIAKVD